ncbi:MAG: threonine synthase [Gemmatimonadetes bacterium]|nr:threonine synthase [Gemmatimonadota bacterium]
MTTTHAAASPTRLTLLPQRCTLCGTEYPAEANAICAQCLGPLEPLYPKHRVLPDREDIARRAPSLWRYREWLPFSGEPVHSHDTGFTPLIEAPRLAARLGVARAWVKNDAVSQPTLSFKDRVVTTAINAAHALGLGVVGCASTGNLANAVASHAARAGLSAWIFIPEDLEPAKIINTAVFGANLVRVRGHYDDVNRLCALLADRFGWGIVNVNLRGYYGEGSKTMAFEIAEQLGWRLPTAVVAPMAGGSLVTKLRKGFGEFQRAELVNGPSPRLYGAQASGCAPIVRLVQSGAATLTPEIPHTIARSIAIGNPADGPFAAKAMVESGGWGAHVSDEEIVAGIRLLAETTGVFAETAGGTTVAAAVNLAREGRLTADDEVVLCITGNGLKTTDVVRDVLPAAPVVDAKVREVAALVAERG